ncbi:MAG TPA: PQQ-binding-like beta-propeller repeat protein [Gaiellaceae bacterium]|nr:PQQ-binding-like beta-propeller repeat protein [Gaiellaceae bacterium]
MPSSSYLDFELEIGPAEGGVYPVAVLHSPAGEGRTKMRFPFDGPTLTNRLQALEIALLRSSGVRRRVATREEEIVQDFGRQLTEALLTGKVRTLFDLSRREAYEKDVGLRLKLRVQAPDLSVIPWEFLYDEQEDEYLALARSTPVVRYLELPQPLKPLTVTPPLKILGMIASPRDQDPLDTGRERKRLEDAVASLEKDGRVELTWIEGETWRDLQRAMRNGEWNVFHFIGHGAYDEAKDEGLIALADDGGRTQLLSAGQLGRLLDDHGPLRLAVLNSCEGARGGTKEVLSSTAAVLMRRGVPAVVAMQYEITDRAAIEFTRAFYEAIADGQPVDGAVSEARIAVSLALESTLEWGVPVLYMHAPDGCIFSVEPGSIPTNGKAIAPPRTPVLERLRGWASGHARLLTAVGAALGAALIAVIATIVLDGHNGGGTPVPQGEPSLRWKFKTGGFVGSSPAIDRDHVFFGSQNQDVYSVAATTGTEKWHFETGKIVFSSPAVADGVVYVGSHDTNLYALNESSGKERWRTRTGGEVESSPAVHGNLVYVGSDDGKVYAFDRTSGFERWRFETGQPVFSSPTVVGRTLYVGSRDDNVYALDARTGNKLWRFTTGDEVWSSPAVAGGAVYVGSNDHNVYALDAATGAELWRFTTGGVVSSSPAVAGGVVYVGSFDHHVYALDARTGKQRWRFLTQDQVFSSPTVSDGVVYVGSHDHNLYALDARTGKMRWRFETEKLVGSSPAVFGGVVYVGSDDGFLYAVEIPTQ